jgi:hypothetical protein
MWANAIKEGSGAFSRLVFCCVGTIGVTGALVESHSQAPDREQSPGRTGSQLPK